MKKKKYFRPQIKTIRLHPNTMLVSSVASVSASGLEAGESLHYGNEFTTSGDSWGGAM